LDKEELLKVEWANTPKIVKEWLPEAIIKNLLKTAINNSFKRYEEDSYGDRFFDYCFVEGAEPGDYKNQIIKLSPKHQIMCGIRFFNLDLKRAYINIEHANFKKWNMKLFNSAAIAIKEKYKMFNPFAYRILSVEEYNNKYPILNFTKDLSYYVGLKGNILSLEKPIKYDLIELVRPENLDFYSLYQGIVEFYIDDNPGAEDYVFALTKKDIERLHEEQTLFSVYIDEQWAGITAVERATEKYLEGYLIVEEILIKKFRGKNFGSAMQHKLIEIMPGDEYTLIFGEIHENNIPSRKTAARNGRIRSGTHYFIYL